MGGFIILDRSFVDWRWFKNANAFRVFVYLLFIANFEPRDFENMTIERGQAVTSYPKLSEALGITEAQARTAIGNLKKTGDITVETTSKFSVITIIEYEKYQGFNRQNNSRIAVKSQADSSQITDKKQADNSQITAIEQYKQINKETNSPPLPPAPKKVPAAKSKPVKEKFAEFVSMTNDEYSSLVAKFGEQGAKRCIEILDNYKGASGKKYSSDYRAILNWVAGRYEEEQAKRSPQAPQPSYDYDSDDPYKNWR